MTITRIDENNTVTLKLEGWLDTLTSSELGKEIEAIGQTDAIVLDFDQLEYISSAGLRQVIACNKKAQSMGASFSVINAGNEVMSIFRLTGVDKKLKVSAK